ncbi:hypothetical protein ACLRGF_01410 [Mycetocola zhadangensis]|uniref:hypothetical protein n=1 Tax=Mycetocola zhadangensis TaxID=1164595 RepID=UPI003A4DEFE3
MAEVWCIVGGSDGRDRYLAEELIHTGNSVAILKNDVSHLAMLVNAYGDAILPIEILDEGDEALAEALHHVEESFGQVDVIAVLLDPCTENEIEQVSTSLTKDRAGFAYAVEVLTSSLPGSTIVIVTGQLNASKDDQLRTRMLNAALEDRLRHAVPFTAQNNRTIDVIYVDDVPARLNTKGAAKR